MIFQYRLENNVGIIGSPKLYNDGEWHTVSASRFQRAGKLQIDNEEQFTTEAQGELNDLIVTDYIYIGGYPGEHHFPEVTNVDFDGCIDSVTISRRIVDLNENIRAYGVKSGCPNKVSSML